MTSPFDSDKSEAGQGTICLALLPPNTPRLKTVRYQYPLKLVSPAPIYVYNEEHAQLVHTVYLLTYGGGLVAGDTIDLSISIEGGTRLTLLTQGSTKLFKSPNRDVISRQAMTVQLAPDSCVCYLPDPVQPFEHSCFEQRQIYDCVVPNQHQKAASLCVLDWVSNGRSANGEDWSFYRYGSLNEVYLQDGAQKRLMLRDNLLLDDYGGTGSLTSRMSGLSVSGTLILSGPVFMRLGQFFMNEFKLHPRIGGRHWDDEESKATDKESVWRDRRQTKESEQHFLWSAASIRGCVVVKFGARELEHARHWLFDMLSYQGTIIDHFGERALLCLR